MLPSNKQKVLKNIFMVRSWLSLLAGRRHQLTAKYTAMSKPMAESDKASSEGSHRIGRDGIS